MIKKSLFYPCCILFVGTVNAESLSQIYQLSLQNDFQMEAAKSAQLAGKEREIIARSQLLPKVNLQGQWQQSETTSHLNSANPLAIESENTTENKSLGYTISLSQPLFDLSIYHNYQMGKQSSMIAELKYEKEKQDLIIRVAEAYLQIVKTWEHLDVAKAATKSFAIQFDIVKDKFSLGLALPSDLRSAKAAVDQSMADEILAENNVSIAFELLTTITGKEHTEILGLANKLTASKPSPDNFQSWYQLIEHNLELSIAKIEVSEAYRNYQAKKSQHLPKLTGSLSYSDQQDDREYSYALPDKFYQDGFSVSLDLTVPIYSGGGVSSSEREAKYQHQQSKYMRLHTERKVKQELHSNYLSINASVAEIQARKIAIKSTEEALSYAESAYVSGVGTYRSILDAQRELFAERNNYINSVYNYLLTGLKLKEGVGTLSGKDIDELSQLFDHSKKLIKP